MIKAALLLYVKSIQKDAQPIQMPKGKMCHSLRHRNFRNGKKFRR